MVTQLRQQPGQVHFRASGLKAALERGLDALLGLRVAHAFGKEIGIAAEVLYAAASAIALTRSLTATRTRVHLN